eukprot:1159042-Pelagomonas_calceolata.AAC.1
MLCFSPGRSPFPEVTLEVDQLPAFSWNIPGQLLLCKLTSKSFLLKEMVLSCSPCGTILLSMPYSMRVAEAEAICQHA